MITLPPSLNVIPAKKQVRKSLGAPPTPISNVPRQSSRTLQKDTVQFSGQHPKADAAEQTKAGQYVDNLLDQCDQQTTVQRMTLRDFLLNAKLEPKRYLPTASSYVLDAFDYYDKPVGPQQVTVYGEPMRRFNIMNTPWNNHLSNPTRIYGHEPTVNRIWEILRSFKQQPNTDRGIALFGPHGSGKSVIAKSLMTGVENFSRQDEGALWTYSFVFPDGQKVKAQPKDEADIWMQDVADGKTLIEPDKIAAQLMANLNLNPIFLLPPQQRTAFLQDLKKEGKIEPDFNIDYYLKANLEGNAQRILNKLHHLYSEDPKKFQKAMEHIQVERWTMSAQDYRGLVEVPASRNPDAVMREIPGEHPLAKAPDLVKTAGKRSLEGLMPRAHRGIFYMDDFGRNGMPFDHLLMPLETGEVTIQELHGPGITKELLDFVPLLSVNPEVLERTKQHGNFDALEQRMLFVPVPFERRYKVESQVMAPILNHAKARGKKIAPDTLESFALWVAMSRMFPIDKNYQPYQEISKNNKDFASALSKLTPLGKALLYQGEAVPGLCADEQEALVENLKTIAGEHNQSLGETEFTLYEGGVGMSNRAATNVLKRVTARHDNEPISFLDMFEAIARYAGNKPQYEMKRAQILKDKGKTIPFQSGLELLREVEDFQRQKFMKQLKDALGMYQDPSVYAQRIQQYGDHIAALQEGKAVPPRSQVDGDPKPSRRLILSFEQTAHPDRRLTDSERKAYRTDFLARAIDWDTELPDEENVTQIYQNEMSRLRTKDEQENKQYLTEFRNNVKILLKDPQAFEPQKGLPSTQRLENALKTLGDMGYSPEVLPKILDWALEHRYVADQVKSQ